jgi:hypothetical protein
VRRIKLIRALEFIVKDLSCAQSHPLTMLHTFESLSPTSTGLIIAFAIAVLGYLVFFRESQSLPLVNGKQPFEIRLIHAKRRFLFGARSLIRAGLDKVLFPHITA